MKFTSLASLGVLAAATSGVALAASPSGTGFANPDLIGFEHQEYVAPVASDFTSGGTAAAPLLAASIGSQRQLATFTPTATVLKSFQGISQYDVASYARNFIPPDTMGAVGTTQFVEVANGGFAVFGKDGTVQKAESDVAFWAAAGQTGTNGDSRVLFDKAAGRWIAESFGANLADIQIAVSKTADATGAWQSVKFTGYAGGIADYPTLAFDTKALYIGTNDFKADGSFGGTTLNIIPLKSLLRAGGPTTGALVQFNTPYSSTTGGFDGGYAIQGVNSSTPSNTGKVMALSLFYNDNVTFDIKNTGTSGATKVNGQYVGTPNYNYADPGRQPNAVPDIQTQSPVIPGPTPGTFVPNPNYHPSNNQVIDTLDPRIGSDVYEVNGLIYSVHTVAPIGSAYSVVRWDVVDAKTSKLVAEGDISDGHHDFYEGSLTVNAKGQVVIGYNRSGSGADGKVSFFAQVFSTDKSGHLTARGAAQLLQVSVVDDYHNGSVDGFVAVGRQRWGDYSQVTLDPTDPSKFWVIGEYAREYNDAAGGHPGGTGGSRWSTWISEINAGTTVPEPASWAMFIAGFGVIGALQRRRRTGYTTA